MSVGLWEDREPSRMETSGTNWDTRPRTRWSSGILKQRLEDLLLVLILVQILNLVHLIGIIFNSLGPVRDLVDCPGLP